MNDFRRAFIVSDRTGISAENMAGALLEQFPNVKIRQYLRPFIDSETKAIDLIKEIQAFYDKDGVQPIVFASISNDEISHLVQTAPALHLSFFDAFLGVLEQELGTRAQHFTRSRVNNVERYDARMEAVNFALNHDDGSSDVDMKEADVILMGVSRSGKTPTCLYLALQYGIRAANYPLTPDDLGNPELPRMVKPYKNKLFGLTIEPERLHHIRQERRANSTYSHINTCKQEVADAQAMFRRYSIPFANTTHKSVEELAVHIMQECKLKRKF
ncbi:posphoenolpyruvate synthetase regulatory kinase/phosphorylase PpsR [Alysiella crassa]|uniref:Putative phosphoenolpyruvate synthase regulatory protein n=1 Tax=Alysiella crassa TaxID=153491 RepID=A0A376BVR9_9NEIS|nr:pyruvate, water dikinase regulatory protein [Alysiella crassa]UOP06422.1 kinase/pyrophosphorylase [Alysiella crassa]SSY80941.1 Putative phosphotransferase ydiA [Alysiella crassa]